MKVGTEEKGQALLGHEDGLLRSAGKSTAYYVGRICDEETLPWNLEFGAS